MTIGDVTYHSSTSSVTYPPTRLTPAECVATGGHCWPDSAFFGPLFPDSTHLRQCKHCGLRQRGVRQEAICWEDVTP